MTHRNAYARIEQISIEAFGCKRVRVDMRCDASYCEPSLSDKESLDSTSIEKIKKGDHQLLFISPEALFASLEWRRMLGGDVYGENLVAFAVDEAHCVTKW